MDRPSSLRRLVLEVTRKCHFHCLHCSVRGGEEIVEQELEAQLFIDTIQDFAGRGGVEVVFTGGEPLERKDLVLNLIRFAKSKGLRTTMYSVGYSLTDSNVSDLSSVGLDEVYLSLEGSPTIHEKITGMPGSYAITLRALSRLRNRGIKTAIHFTPMQINYKEIDHVCKVAERNSVRTVKILNFVPQGRGYDNASTLLLSPGQREEFISFLSRLRSNAVEFDFGGNPLNTEDSSSGCHAAEKIVVTNTGTVIPCSALRSTRGVPSPPVESVLGDLTLSSLNQLVERLEIVSDGSKSHSCGAVLTTKTSVRNSASPITSHNAMCDQFCDQTRSQQGN